jgi:DNA-binding NtrC family response regulator
MTELIVNNVIPGREGRVLVVDDEQSVRKPIRVSLTKAGYEVVEAEDGQQAMQVLREGDNPLMVDTIVCDIRMPKIDGIDAIAYFRQQFPSIPVVVLTGYPDVYLASALFKQGVMDFLVKPITRETLLATIRKTISEHVILSNQFVA